MCVCVCSFTCVLLFVVCCRSVCECVYGVWQALKKREIDRRHQRSDNKRVSGSKVHHASLAKEKVARSLCESFVFGCVSD